MTPPAFIVFTTARFGLKWQPNGESGASRPQATGRGRRVTTSSSSGEIRAPFRSAHAVTRNCPTGWPANAWWTKTTVPEAHAADVNTARSRSRP